MNLIVKMICLTVILCGCSAQNIKDIDDHLSADCTRHYTGSFSAGLGTQGAVTFQIDCSPSGVKPAVVMPPSTP